MDLHRGLLEKAGDKSWEEIALIARDLEVRIENDDEEARKLEKKLRVIKQVLYETMQDPQRMKHLSSKFYVRLTGVMEEMEEKLKRYRAEEQEFVLFLKILLSKLRKEGLVVTHRLDRKMEFVKHKGSKGLENEGK